MGEGAKSHGRLIVISGASGSGKSTIARRAVANPKVKARLSVSATTRPARLGELDGRDYYFLSQEQFESDRAAGRFLESAQVHGHLYGTPIGPVEESLASGHCVILEIDVQGALIVRERIPSAFLIFVNVPSYDELEARLRARATDSEATITKRLANARRENEMASQYDYQLLNKELDQAVDDLVALLIQQGCGG
jgi:guanylate kinase